MFNRLFCTTFSNGSLAPFNVLLEITIVTTSQLQFVYLGLMAYIISEPRMCRIHFVVPLLTNLISCGTMIMSQVSGRLKGGYRMHLFSLHELTMELTWSNVQTDCVSSSRWLRHRQNVRRSRTHLLAFPSHNTPTLPSIVASPQYGNCSQVWSNLTESSEFKYLRWTSSFEELDLRRVPTRPPWNCSMAFSSA